MIGKMPKIEITSNPDDDLSSKKIRTELARVEAGAGGIERLEEIKTDVEIYASKARTEHQKRLVEEYYFERDFQEALASATLVELLESEDEEIKLRAAKELRGKGGNVTQNVDKAVFIQREDPEIKKLKEGI